MTLPAYAVDFRGHPACPCQAAWLPVFEHEAQRRGFLRGPLPISQLIGDAAVSGNTHRTGGAADFYPLSAVLDIDGFVWLARQMGADATFERPENWDGDGGVHHAHSVLSGCPHNEPARYQIYAVQAGYNGLGYLGHSAPDDGPKPLSGRTWRQGIAWAHLQEDEDMAQYAEQLDKIAADAARAAAAAEQATRMLDNQRERQRTQTTRLREKLDKAIATGKATRAELEAMRAELDGED